ncbi:MAG: glycoside hydrolase family 3 C-terminal domain-containing protein [Clostridia bacterium]|nr:glycoside hydrolase family 3 C-terminal domain-containing protein [Clostridia bacterium]
MSRLFSKTAWGILTSIFTVVLIAVLILSYVATNYASAAINMMFGTSNFETINDPDAEAQIFHQTKYDFELNGENLYKEDAAMIEEAEAAGAVLLWNKSSALPLSGNENVSLLGHATVDVVECGTGSGYVETFDYTENSMATLTMKEAFESRGFHVNPTLWNFYSTGDGSSYRMIKWNKALCTPWQQWTVNEVPQSVYTSDVYDSYAVYGDVAIVMLARSGGEYSDLHYNYSSSSDFVGNNDKGTRENTSAEGGYLGLSDEEDALLTDILSRKDSGIFEKVVLLINTGNPLQMQDLEPYYDGIDACMWIGQPGSTGMNAVADLLKGKDMNGNPLTPSGRLPDTWVYDNNSAPATVNDGNYTYGNADLITAGHGTASYSNKYMVYQEGIYIGYRYYETRYFDSVTGNGNADSVKGAKHSNGGWNYDDEVAFPFGYGLSYTEFEYSDFKVKENNDHYEVSVTVRNSGHVAGKEVVQVYLSKPYTQYDIENKIEKAAVELVGYDKTALLQPGASETVTIKVDKESFKTYDTFGQAAYIIEEGTYYLTVATDSHVATNNVLENMGESSRAQIVLGGSENTKQVSLGKDFVYAIELEKDYKTYLNSTQTGVEVTNQLASGDINTYENRGENSVTYLSRSDWDATYPESHVVLVLNAEMAKDLLFNNIPNIGDNEMPVYGVFESGSTNGIPDVANGDLVAIMFMDAPLYPDKVTDEELLKLVYDDGLTYVDHWNAMWDQLLDQMTFEEQCYIVVNSYHWIHGATSIALPESRQENGPVGITKRTELFFSLPNDDAIKGEDGTGWTWLAYPCAGILAASFDTDIAQRVGEHKSEDMLYLGYNGIYGPGVNMHRSPFGGRAFEYPSEDPYLAGYTAAYETIGIESKGAMAYVKHYALNDMETNRVNCGIWSTEQASREIYLRAFEIVFTVGKASATMNSFTRIGTTWNGASYEMMTAILRDEWGYDGLVISDWVTDGSAMSYVDGVMAGTDTFDGNGLASELTKYSENAAVAQAVRLAAKRVIYNVIQTNVMNGMSITSRTVPVTPWWETALVNINYGVGAIWAVCLGMFLLSAIFRRRS